MTRSSSFVAALLALMGMIASSLSGCASTSNRSADVAATQNEATSASTGNRQLIVVTVRNAKVSASAHAGSTMRDYDDAAYGPSPRAQSTTQAIANRYGVRQVDAWAIGVLGVHCIVYAVPSQVNVDDLLARMHRDVQVESAQLLQSFATLTTDYPDRFFELQKNLLSLQVPQAHRVARGEGIRIAVIDTGVDATHPDLAGRIEQQRNFVSNAIAPAVPERHGTAVAGVIAAIANNNAGILGVAPAAHVLALRACWAAHIGDAHSVCNTFTLAQALTAAIDMHADIINLSLTGPVDPLLDRLVKVGIERGIFFVAAMPAQAASVTVAQSTTTTRMDRTGLGFPLNTAGVLGVDTVESTNASLDALRAPGKNIFTLAPNGSYDFMSGSSLAAASVSGGIALLLSQHHRLGREQVETALLASMRGTRDGVVNDNIRSVDFCTALASFDRRVLCE